MGLPPGAADECENPSRCNDITTYTLLSADCIKVKSKFKVKVGPSKQLRFYEEV